MEHSTIIDIIKAKRDGKELSKEQIQAFISQLISENESVHEAQIGAFLMAVFINGLTPQETSFLTKSMTYSGFNFSWPSSWKGTVVDKHSTGGIGDKTSLILAPALAANGLHVPMISGRGLDVTGGTLDKLESIPGFRVSLDTETINEVLESVGCCIVGQTNDIVPADKYLYRIRDTTATVDYENLIVASIISKKAAENLDALVLDVKVGSGALCKDLHSAKSLAHNLVSTGSAFGMKVSAFVTNMESPLGYAVGNALEVAEAIETLQNNGPKDLYELVLQLGAKLLESTGHVKTFEEGKARIDDSIKSGMALDKFEMMLVAQGTAPEVANQLCRGDKWTILPRAKSVTTIKAHNTGYLGAIDSFTVGKVVHGLGCGRTAPGLPVKFEPGVVLRKKSGDWVEKDDVIFEVHHNESLSERDLTSLTRTINIVPNMPKLNPLVFEVIGNQHISRHA